MEKKDKKKDQLKPSRIAKITSPKAAAKPKKSSSLSPAMATWAKANRKMIEKSGTKKQRAMLAQLDKGKTKGVGPVKSGAEYARSLNKGKSTPLPKSARNTPKPKPAAKKPSTAPHNLMKPGVMVGSEDRPQRGYKPGKTYGEDVKPLSKTQKQRKSRRGTPAKKTPIRAPGSTASRNRQNRRRRGR